MLKQIVVAAVCIAACMAAIKDGRVLRTVGVTAGCSVVQTATDGSELAACHPGRLEKRPDLSRSGCENAGLLGSTQYWRCPATARVR
jgi:hypothetical protein